MRYSVMLEKMPEGDGVQGGYYAHVPSLGLTTHGSGLEGALEAVRDLLGLWLEEKKSHGEVISGGGEAVLATVEVA
jgi:predicted RNase H-like HicB family nuclease